MPITTASTHTAEAARLRRRAQSLRDLADRIGRTPALDLGRHAGDETWRGPGPALCRAVLAANAAQLRNAATALHRHALSLDHEAARLEAAARAAIAVGGS